MKVILTSTALKLSHASRLEIAKRSIKALGEVRGISDWTLYVGIEKNCDADIPMYEAIDFMPVVIVKNMGPQSAHINNINVWRNAHEDGAEFVAFVEDDVIVAPDFCEYMDALGAMYKDDPSVFCINGYTGNEDVKRKFAVWRKPSLGTWGFGMWRDRTQECLDDYDAISVGHIVTLGWDVCLNANSRRGRDAIMPCYSRCINLGAEGIHSSKDPELKEGNRTWSGNDSEIIEKIIRTDVYYEIEYDKSQYVKHTQWKA